MFDEELVLLGEDGAPFLNYTKQKAYIIRGKSWVNNHAHVLRARNGIFNAYIKYYLDTVDYHGFVTGTTRLKLNQASMKQIPVPVAPPEQQKHIVAEIEKQFSRFDEAVANLKRVKANLKRYKAAVLKAAVEGKLTEEWRLSARAENRIRAQASELEAIPQFGKGKYFAYIIECNNGSYYISQTSDLHERWERHCQAEGAEWTKRHPPKYLIHFEEFPSRAEAVDREKKLKTGFGRTWIKREIAAKKLKPLVHNPDNQNSLPVHGVQTGQELLERILAERRKKWEEAELAKKKAKGKVPKDDKWKKKYKEIPQITADEVDQFPELPANWTYVRLGELIKKPQYGTSKKCDYVTNGIGVLRIPNVVNGFIDASDLKFAEFDERECQTYGLEEADILTIRSNGSVSLVGKCALVKKQDEKYLYAGYLIRLRPLKNVIHSEYVTNCLASLLLRKQIESKAKSTSGVNNINSGELQSLIVPICSKEEHTMILNEVDRKHSIVSGIKGLIDTNLHRAERLRQSILSKAFSGQLIEP